MVNTTPIVFNDIKNILYIYENSCTVDTDKPCVSATPRTKSLITPRFRCFGIGDSNSDSWIIHDKVISAVIVLDTLELLEKHVAKMSYNDPQWQLLAEELKIPPSHYSDVII